LLSSSLIQRAVPVLHCDTQIREMAKLVRDKFFILSYFPVN